MQLSLDQLIYYAPYALQALVPVRVFIVIALGATVYWLVPSQWRQQALIAISLSIVLFGYERPMLLPLTVTLVCGVVYLAVSRGVPRKPILVGIIALYGLAHFAFGLIALTPWLRFTGLTSDYVLPTIGLTTAFTFLRMIHFVVDYGATPFPFKLDNTGDRPQPNSRVRPLPFAAWCLFFPTFVHLPLIRYQAWSAQFEQLPVAPTLAFVKKGVHAWAKAC